MPNTWRGAGIGFCNASKDSRSPSKSAVAAHSTRLSHASKSRSGSAGNRPLLVRSMSTAVSPSTRTSRLAITPRRIMTLLRIDRLLGGVRLDVPILDRHPNGLEFPCYLVTFERHSERAERSGEQDVVPHQHGQFDELLGCQERAQPTPRGFADLVVRVQLVGGGYQ